MIGVSKQRYVSGGRSDDLRLVLRHVEIIVVVADVRECSVAGLTRQKIFGRRERLRKADKKF